MTFWAAKAAGSYITKTLARVWEAEGRKPIVILMEPGCNVTTPAEWDFENDMDTCIAGIIRVIEGLKKEDNGKAKHVKWNGESHSL